MLMSKKGLSLPAAGAKAGLASSTLPGNCRVGLVPDACGEPGRNFPRHFRRVPWKPCGTESVTAGILPREPVGGSSRLEEGSCPGLYQVSSVEQAGRTARAVGAILTSRRTGGGRRARRVAHRTAGAPKPLGVNTPLALHTAGSRGWCGLTFNRRAEGQFLECSTPPTGLRRRYCQWSLAGGEKRHALAGQPDDPGRSESVMTSRTRSVRSLRC